MATVDLATVIVVGALVGLSFVALGYAQMVWFARRRLARDAGAARSAARPWARLFWASAALAALCFLRALTSRALPERPGFLVGEDLFAVRPRPGLVARYETHTADVRRDDVLVRFTGQDGEEGQLAVKSRRQLLEGELEIEKAKPLEFDHELIRRVEAAKATLRDREARAKQLASERDAITRELTQQRLALANRRFRIEQDDRAADRELAPLRASVATERDALKSQQGLLEKGLVSQVEAARERDALAELEGRAGQLGDQRRLLARERREVAALRELAERNYARQLEERSAELAAVSAEVDAARRVVELASAAVEQDRPRAVAQREKRLRQIQVQIEESDWLLSGRGRELTVRAPWDGRIGFREPSPASAPADNGPLVVLYHPGKIAVAVKLEAGEASAGDSRLEADLQLAASSERGDAGARGTTVRGSIVQRTLLPDGSGELHVACDPPDRVVRQLAMGGTVPVVARVRRGLTSSGAFWAALAFSGLALAAAGWGAVRRRPASAAEPPAPTAPGLGDEGGPPPGGPGAPTAPALPWRAAPALHGEIAAAGALAVLAAVGEAVRRRVLGATAPLGPAPASLRLAPARDEAPPLVAPPGAAAAAAPIDGALQARDLSYLRDLGATLKRQIEDGCLAPEHVRTVNDALRTSGFRAAALVGAGFGASVDKASIERAAFDLLASGASSGLGDATRDCAELLRVLRVIAPERMNGTLDRLRVELVAAALDAAERGGSSSEAAASVVGPLVEG